MNTRSEIQRKRRRLPGLAGLAGLAGLMLGLTGCSMLRFHHAPPRAEITSLQLATNGPNTVTLDILQLQVMRFADGYVAAVAQASDDFAARVGTPKARLAALRWKLGQASSAYIDATGPNPVINALDTLVLVSVSRMVIEDYGVETYGDAALPLLEIQRREETNAWTLADSTLKPNQQRELRELIQEWRRRNPNQRYIGAVRFREFVTALGRKPQAATTAPNSIFSLLFLDPFAGLDPTAAAIEETRRLAERAMYYTQRMPQLLSWQAEVLAYQLAAQPESVQVLSNANQLAASAQSLAQTVQQLPQLVTEQRQATIQQLLDGLQSQDTDVRQTLNAGTEAATAINGAIRSLDQFVRYVSPPDTNTTVADTNSRPFNVLDYGTAATQVGAAARDLNALLATANQSTTQFNRLREQTAADADRVVDHAFRLGLVLILVFLAGMVFAGLIYRVLANKLAPAGRKPAGPDSGTP